MAFDDPNLVSSAGLVPVKALADAAGVRDLTDERLSVDSIIDDMAVLRHGGMGRVFKPAYAPSTLGSYLRAFTFGPMRRLDAVASRFLLGLAGLTPLLGGPGSEQGAGTTGTRSERSSERVVARAVGCAATNVVRVPAPQVTPMLSVPAAWAARMSTTASPT